MKIRTWKKTHVEHLPHVELAGKAVIFSLCTIPLFINICFALFPLHLNMVGRKFAIKNSVLTTFQCYQKIAKINTSLEEQGFGRKHILSIFLIRSTAFYLIYIEFLCLSMFLFFPLEFEIDKKQVLLMEISSTSRFIH